MSDSKKNMGFVSGFLKSIGSLAGMLFFGGFIGITVFFYKTGAGLLYGLPVQAYIVGAFCLVLITILAVKDKSYGYLKAVGLAAITYPVCLGSAHFLVNADSESQMGNTALALSPQNVESFAGWALIVWLVLLAIVAWFDHHEKTSSTLASN